MKKNQLLFALCAVLLCAFAVAGKSMVGHWKIAFGNAVNGNGVFRKDGSYEVTFKGQTWKVGGQYKVDGSKVSISDSTCGLSYWGSYKANWFSDDSVQITVIEDTCAGRKANGDGAVFVRMK